MINGEFLTFGCHNFEQFYNVFMIQHFKNFNFSQCSYGKLSID